MKIALIVLIIILLVLFIIQKVRRKIYGAISFSDFIPLQKHYIILDVFGVDNPSIIKVINNECMSILMSIFNNDTEDDSDKSSTTITEASVKLGNAFTVKMDQKILFCTAFHCLPVSEYFRKIGRDIVLLENGSIYNKSGETNDYYEVDTTPKELQFVSILGYQPNINSDSVLKKVQINGLAIRVKSKDFFGDDDTFGGNEFTAETMLVIKYKFDYKVAGLSGSPAFNKNGKVVGLLSSDVLMKNDKSTDKYLVIQPFE